MLRFATPWALSLLPLVIAATWWMARRTRRAGARLALPSAAATVALGRSAWVRLERLLPWLRGLVLVLIVVCLARPQSGASIESVSTLGVDIVIALDISGSMRAEDFQPDNRLAVARRTVAKFIEGRPPDRIGLVVFASLSVTRCPLTLDHQMLLQFLDEVGFAPRELDGTAIGLGLATAVNRLRESDARSKVVVLVTDGRNTGGQIGPMAAAEIARALDVKVHTIGVGSKDEVPVPFVARGRTVYQNVRIDLDEKLLQEIAQHTGGRYFPATDAEGLQEVFQTIDELEKTEIQSNVRVIYSELFPFILLPAVLLLVLERALAGTRLRRIP